jgi:hypothetical protein
MTMPESTSDDAGQARDGALEALLEVANEPDMLKEHRTANAAFTRADYEQLVAIAWRQQFNDDRTKFKRELRELQQHVSQRILDLLEERE